MSKSAITTAMVMAAGHGTRMRPITDTICKAMVEVGGKRLIDHMLDRLLAAGIQTAIVNVHTFADSLEAHLKARTKGPKIIISDERDMLLETGGGVVKALPLLGNDPILICNIDAIWASFEPVLKGLLSAWQPEQMDELFLLIERENTLGYAGKGDFTLAPDGRIARRSGDSAPYVYAGVEIFKPNLAKNFNIEKFSRNKIWDGGLKDGKIYGHVMKAYWMHVGDPQARIAAQAVLKQASYG